MSHSDSGSVVMEVSVTAFDWRHNQTQGGLEYVPSYPDTGWNFTRNSSWSDTETSENVLIVTILKSIVMVLIMFLAVAGNSLVIISVYKFERLRIIANSFIVSLAFADMLVASVVMPFNASQEIAGRWMFGRIFCDVFNANDVLFSTASLTHLCCISTDRYIAIMDPFHYETKMTARRVALMLVCAWGASALISHVPIHLGWYTTEEHRQVLDINSHICSFKVNKIYAVISSVTSFWVPAVIMVFTYVKIFREARRQEKQITKITKLRNPSLEHLNNNSGNGHTRNGAYPACRLAQDRKKLKREHKAAKTLGIIMGAFLFCWLPFFVWYVASTLCDSCHTPDVVVAVLFWVGYFNSALNPMIYAFFNRDFRHAFKKILRCHKLPHCRKRRRKAIHSDIEIGVAAELQATRPTCLDPYEDRNSSSTPSPRTRRYYDSMDNT